MIRPVIRCCLVLVVGLGTVACGSAPTPTPHLDHLPGARVAEMAERQLEAAHPGMAPGTMQCPDLDWKVGATVRCRQTVELSKGRVLVIPGTVRVTEVDGGGRLHVRLDDAVAAYGITGTHLSADLLVQARRRLRSGDASASCPALIGQVGTTVRCTVGLRGRTGIVLARVTERVPQRYATSCAFDWRRFRLR